MRFRTIWSIRAMSLPERLRRTRDWAAMEIAARLPLRIRYWVTIHELAKATYTSSDVPATSLEEILKNLETPKVVS